MPVILRLNGFRFLFYSNEGSPVEPAHVHVVNGGDEAKFWTSPEVELAFNEGFDARTLNWIQGVVEARREELERAWNEYFA